MKPRVTLIISYIGLMGLICSPVLFGCSRIESLRKNGISTTAHLDNYFTSGAGRAGTNAVYGNISFPINGKFVKALVYIGHAADPSDKEFSEATSSRQVPIVYSPSKPSNAASNIDGQFTSQSRSGHGVMLALLACFMVSIIFGPAIIVTWKS